jgi:hypothetical protein
VTQDLRLLDAAGNELAVLGREAAGPVVLALNAEGDPSRQLLRFAASKTGHSSAHSVSNTTTFRAADGRRP